MSKNAYHSQKATELEEHKKRIDVLRADTKKSSAEGGKQHYQLLDQLEKKVEATKKKLEELGNASEEAWESLRKGVENSLSELSKSLKETFSKLR